MTRVSDLMRRGLISCDPRARLGDVARLLLTHRVHSLVVAENGGPPLGLISDTDLLTGEWLSGDDKSLATMRGMTARDLMTLPVITIEADAPAGEAVRRMREGDVHRLVVTEYGKAVGVISVSDFVAGLAGGWVGRGNVGDVMSRGLVVCRRDTPLPAVAWAMTERRSRSVVVIGPTGKTLGVVTGVDVMKVWGDGKTNLTAADLMQPPIIIGPEASLREAADLMLKYHIHRLIVVDPSRPNEAPLGLISTSDILAEMAAPESVWQTAA
ncbi:MAG: CBS domain-containing protein [Chloroflexi bacterium]|nr:CBS domain-containing protein [Chloroflexota bacterium]